MVECLEAFDKVKYALTHTLILALPTFSEPFKVICDASIVGIGLQKGQPIDFESRKFSHAKKIIPLGSKNL